MSEEGLLGGANGSRYSRSDVARLPVPRDERKLTNCLFCLLFVVFWAGMGFIAVTSVKQAGGATGFQRLTNGQQYDGQICGVDTGVADKNFVYWPTPTHAPAVTVCVNACPGEDDPTEYSVYHDGMVASYPAYATTASYHYCIPKLAVDGASQVLNDLENAAFGHVVSDLGRAWPVLAGAAGVSVVAGFLYLAVLQRTAGCLIWILITVVMAGLGLGSYVLVTHARNMAPGDQGKTATLWTGIGLGIADLLFILLVCGLRKSIRLAVAILEEATKAVRDMKALLVVPPVKFLALAVMFAYWVSVSVYMASAGATHMTNTTLPATTNGTMTLPVHTIEWDTTLWQFFVYHFFGLLWTVAFFVAIGDLIMAHATAKWYFTAASSGTKHLGSPVSEAVGTTLGRHLGTAAFGSMILAIVGLVKWAMRYVHKKLHGKTGGNLPLKFLLCMCMCCIQCFERIVKFVGRHAYIQTAMFGTPFCESARSSFSMFARNAGRVAAVTMVGGIFLLLGQLLVAAASGLFAYFITVKYYSGADGVSSPVMPTVVAGIIGYVVGSTFTQVFDMSINTILHCFVADMDANTDGRGKGAPEYASRKLTDAVTSKRY